MRTSLQGDGHFCLFGTLEIGHTLYPGVQRVMCMPFSEILYYGASREDYVFVRPPGVDRFELTPDNVWYGRIKLLFSISVESDVSDGPITTDCAYVSFCYEIQLETAGKHTHFVQ